MTSASPADPLQEATPCLPGAAWRFFVFALLLALAAAALERGVAYLRGALAEPGLGARWIWAEGADEKSEPLAFFLRRDFVLAETAPAWLAIAADEEYIVWLNGRRVGSGLFRAGAAIDFYDVGGLLEIGGNRLVVELRSSRGAGGLLANLRLGERDRIHLVSDGDWRVHRNFEPALLRGWELENSGEPPEIWGSHPTGRWRIGPPEEPRKWPVLDLLPAPEPSAERVAAPSEQPRWVDLEPFRGHGFPELGYRLLLDWGEEVTGVLRLELDPAVAGGLVHLGSTLPKARPPADALVVPVPGSGVWEDVVARTFRYAFLIGIELRSSPVVRSTAVVAESPPLSGVFGITPPRRETLSEENIRLRAMPARSTPEETRPEKETP